MVIVPQNFCGRQNPAYRSAEASALDRAGAQFSKEFMKKILFMALFLFSSLTAYAALSGEDNKTEIASKSLRDGAFVVATDESSATDSLNRVSGQYDLGFAAPDQTYQSEHHYKPGPFGKATAEEQAQKNNY